MNLYSYCLRYDDGAAPNPHWGICTLVIRKPVLRRTAIIGDWIVGLGSTNSPLGDVSENVVYAMRVTDKMTMEAYDRYCRDHYLNKIPYLRSRDDKRRMGDCIYDYSNGSPPRLRWSVHTEANRETDLGGKFALISDFFYYFGDKPLKLPDKLKPIIHRTQGHKSISDQSYGDVFVSWIEKLGYKPNILYGEPQLKTMLDKDFYYRSKCSRRDLEESEEGEKCGLPEPGRTDTI